MTSVIYSPALSGMQGWQRCLSNTPLPWYYRWWRSGGKWRHPHLLLSYGLAGDIHVTPSLLYGSDEPGVVVADSGGFQAVSKGTQLDPVKVFEWQRRFANIAIALDFPIKKLDGVDRLEWFDHFAGRTRSNILAVKRLVEGEKGKLMFYGVLHGYWLEEMQRWWSHFEDLRDLFDGAAFGIVPNRIYQLELMLSFAHSLGFKRIHVLGVAGAPALLVLHWWADKFELITADTTSPFLWARNGLASLPLSPFTLIGVGKGSRRNASLGWHMDWLPCSCPVCEGKLDIGRMLDYNKLGVHNLFWVVQFGAHCEWLSKVGKLEEFINEFTSTRSYRRYSDILRVSRAYLAKGLEAASRVHWGIDRGWVAKTQEVDRQVQTVGLSSWLQ